MKTIALLLLIAGSTHALTLVENGTPKVRIVAKADAQDAAAELVRVIEEMSGAKLPVEGDLPAIMLGEAADLKVEKTSRAKDGFRCKVVGNRLIIVGESPAGVYTGVERLLESLGCGWYVPGDVGEVIPQKKTIELPDNFELAEVSNSINRRFWYGGGSKGKTPATAAWLRRMNGANFESGSWSHAYAGLISKDVLKAHPEYGSLVRGKRTTKQLCTSNPDVIRTAAETLTGKMAKSNALVFPAGPNDGGGLCECPECAKLDTPGYLEPSSGKPATTDRVFGFASALADITSKQFPDRDLGILVYSEYSRVPQKLTKLSPNVFPMIAPIRRCRIHGPGNPNCEMSRLLQEEIRGWAKLGPKLGFYMYNYNLADSLLPFSKVDFYKRTLAEVNASHIDQLAWIFETIDSWAAHAPSLWLSARISWSTHLDVDREMERFYTGFYGAAAEPLKAYWTRLDNAYAMTPMHCGSSYGMHKIWTPPLLAAARADIERGLKLAANDRERAAVQMAEAGLVSAELFMKIWNAIAACDFPAAAAAQKQLEEHCKAMDAKPEPHWAHLRYAFTQYYMTFVGKVVDAGNALGKIVVKLPDTWEFNGKPLGTMSTCWADEGLTWFQGEGTYRTTFAVPADAKGLDLNLWFGGFDNNVDVTLNGHALGEKTGFIKPQSYENIGAHLNYGGNNEIVVRVAAGSLAEIGTGGIMMPVVIYQGKAAAPDSKPKPAYEM
ncbi:MAG: hypothetical protein PCFJNLEI_02596 [Verrucomicrobiae bacterium]|nr:hypothetical protein [Verrucomicrobiae bacterium]